MTMTLCEMCDHCELQDHWIKPESTRDWLRPDWIVQYCRQKKRKCSDVFDCNPAGIGKWQFHD